MRYGFLKIFSTVFCILFLTAVQVAASDGAANKPAAGSAALKGAKDSPPPVQTHHTVNLHGKTLKYTAVTGYMDMKDEGGQKKASIFYIAYSKDGARREDRPITFTFNGGPGSSSVWLHMGGLGPKRVQMSKDGLSLPPPYRYRDNPYTWLEFTDLVFIDPVGTGYSRPAPGVDKKEFFGVEEDVEAVGDFIRLYVTRNGRWLSPKFICGESYGTTRAAGLSGYLQGRHGIFVQGIVLVSAVLHFQNSRFTPGNDMPHALFLPTFTATAWYHGKLKGRYAKDLRATLKEVEAWALNDYLVALAKGSRLSKAEREQVIDKLSQYTGLSREYIDNVDLRIQIYRFTRELLRGDKATVGRLDSRFKTDNRDAAGETFEFDPSMAAIDGPFAAVINHYLAADLGYKNDLPYRWIGRVRPWNWGSAGRGYVNTAEILRGAMAQDKNLKVMVAAGYYDMATPYFAADYTVAHMGLPDSLTDNIHFTYYEAGHMMYIHYPSLKKLYEDARQFYRDTVGR